MSNSTPLTTFENETTTTEDKQKSPQETLPETLPPFLHSFILEESQTLTDMNLSSAAIAGSVASVIILFAMVVLASMTLVILYSIHRKKKIKLINNIIILILYSIQTVFIYIYTPYRPIPNHEMNAKNIYAINAINASKVA